VRAFFLYLGGFCLLWGLGVLTGLGGVLISDEYRLTPYDLFYFGLSFLMVIWSVIWVYFRGGAAFLARHGMLFRHWPSSPTGIKIAWALLVAATLGGIGSKVAGALQP
jgi:hypothetical protein